MAKCKRCGGEPYMMNKGICGICRDKFLHGRTKAWEQVEDEFGNPTADNLKAMQKRLAEIEEEQRREKFMKENDIANPNNF